MKGYQLLAVDPVPLPKLLAWIPMGKSGSVYDRRCRRIDVTRYAKSLGGRRVTGRSVTGKSMSVTHAGFTFDSWILLTDGGTDYYVRQGRKWIKSGGGAHGCASNAGRMLSRVTATAAYYDGTLVKLSVVCGSRLRQTQQCQQGGQRVCTSCSSWTIRAKAVSPSTYHRYGRGPTVAIGLSKPPPPVDCRKPCPGARKAQEMRDLGRFLRKRHFLDRSSPEHPYLFRSKKACQSYRKRYKMSKADLNVW